MERIGDPALVAALGAVISTVCPGLHQDELTSISEAIATNQQVFCLIIDKYQKDMDKFHTQQDERLAEEFAEQQWLDSRSYGFQEEEEDN